MPNPIPIDVTLTTWNALVGPNVANGTPAQLCQCRFAFPTSSPPPTGPHKKPYIEITGPNQNNLLVRGDVTFDLRFIDRTPNPGGPSNPPVATYRPTGISFYALGVASGGALGIGDLPPSDIRFDVDNNGTPYLRVRDKWTKKGTQGKWKYTIVVQDANGNIGAIDPEIENDINPAMM
jgi:hypothetical protein